MTINVLTVYPDGTQTVAAVEVPDDYFPGTDQPAPTQTQE
ncbi:hypothetical protein SDC9_71486 [bioreactor metagenome]|uniref:Uncharacterized protein n=1 Tax=bioreactor metagenome TaxID=1076179 RepID=A0A644Y9Y6_9ZZZZ